MIEKHEQEIINFFKLGHTNIEVQMHRENINQLQRDRVVEILRIIQKIYKLNILKDKHIT
ncbi:MAG: hypothetical protein EZS28_044894, partial [Streblomastix strix]